MRIGSKMRVFRVTDYEMHLWLNPWRSAMPLLFEVGQEMERTTTQLRITQFDGDPFVWHVSRVEGVLSKLVQTFLEIRGNSELTSFNAVFDTEIGIDLVAVIQLDPNRTVQVSLIGIRFDLKHTKDKEAPLAYDRLLSLFGKLVHIAQPEHAEVLTFPPITQTWFEDIRVSVDLTKVPITIHWLNYFNHEWVERLGGEEKIRHAPAGEVIEMPSGLIFVMQKEPFSYDDPTHVTRQKSLVNYLGLSDLHKHYPKPQ